MPRPDPHQLGFDFTRVIAAATAPVDSPLTKEEQAAIDCLPVGDGWSAFAASGCEQEAFDVSIVKKAWESARVYVTATRLGVTSGCSYNLGNSGYAGGGSLWPNRDEDGLYLWRDRDAAIRHGAHELWTKLSDRDAKRAAEVLRVVREDLGFDATLPPPESGKRRLLSRAEHLRRVRSLTPRETSHLWLYEGQTRQSAA